MLNGVRVLDLSRVMAGPWATQLLADLGAEVVKVEKPGSGDDTRHWGPPHATAADGTAFAAYYLAANRGKRSVAIDMTRPEGQELIRGLAAISDVFVENFKAGTLARYGLDYESLRLVNPRLVYCSITGFGQTGPMRAEPGYDYMIQAMGGLMSVTGEPGGEPMRVGVPFADLLTGMYASNAILAALYRRTLTSEGAWLDLALLDVQVAALSIQAMNYLASGTVPCCIGNAHPNIVPYQLFHTADRPLVVAVGNDRQFTIFAQVIGMPELAHDPRFQTNSARVQHRDALVPLLAERFRTQTAEAWQQALKAAHIPCGPVLNIDQTLSLEQVRERGGVRAYANGITGLGGPIHMDGQERGLTSPLPPPALGEHTGEILSALLNRPAAEIDALRAAGVIG